MLKIKIEDFGKDSLLLFENRIYDHLEKEEDYILILPNRKIIQKIRERALDKFGVIGDLYLYTFEDLIERTNKQSEIGMYFVDIILKRSIENLQNQKKIEKESLYLSKGFLVICKQILSLLRNSNADIKSLEKSIDLDSLKTILKILAEYELQMKKYNIPDPYGAPILDKSICEKFKGYKIYITGFQEFRPVELEWIKEASCNPVEISIQGSSDFSVVNKTVEKLRDMGFIIEEEVFNLFEKEKSLLSGEENTQIKLLRAEDPYLEAKGICREIKRKKIQGIAYDRMTIAIKTADQEDLLLYHLEKEDIPYHYDKNLPLLKLPFFRDLKTVISEYENLQAFLYANAGDPLIAELENKTSLKLKSLFLRKNYQTLEEYKRDQDITIEEDQKSIESFFSRGEKWIRIFESNHKEAFFEELIELLKNKIKEEDPFDREPYKDFLFWTEQISGQYYGMIDSLDNREFCDFLSEAFDIFTYREKRSLYGVEIRNIREIKLSDCDILFIPGCNDTNYPRKKEYHYFFNEKTVEALKNAGVSLHNTSEDLEEDRLDFLSAIFSAKRCLFFSHGAEDLPSFYLRNLKADQDILHYSVKDFIKPDFDHISTESDLKKHNGIFEEKKIEIPSEKAFYLKSSYSLSELETYNSCPAQYYYRYKMGLSSPYEDPAKYETLLLGIVCHEMLELFYKNYTKEIVDYLNRDLFDWAEKKEFVEKNILSIAEMQGFNIRLQEVKLELSLYAGHILRLIRKDLESLKKEPKLFLPSRFEENIEVEHLYKGQEGEKKIVIRGRVDRIDESTDGEKIFIDYKLGSGSVKTWGDYEKGDTLQFPVYSLAGDPKSCKYLSVKKEEITPFYTITDEGRTKGEITVGELKEMQENIRNKIDEILEGIGTHDFARGPEKEGVCNYCDYKMICRIRREEE